MNRDSDERIALAGESSGAPEQIVQEDSGANLAHLLIALRQHWKLAAIAWPLLMAIMIPAIWLLAKPKYTASAHVKVDPVLGTLLDRQTQAMPLFDSYLASQAILMSSGKVLNDALADPKLKGLPLLKELDPAATLRENITVAAVPRTQVIRLDVKDDDPKAAILLADAILASYLKFYGGRTEIDQNLEFLKRQEEELTSRLRDLKSHKLRLADEYKAMTDSMFEKLREMEAKSSEQTRQNLEAVELQIFQMEEEIKQVAAGVYLPVDDASPLRQQEAIERSPLVNSLRQRLIAETERLVRLQSGGLTEAAPDVIKTKEQIERLKAELDKERTRAADDYVKDQQALLSKLKDNRLAILRSKLESARQIKQRLDDRIAAQDSKDRRMGQFSIEIQSDQEKIEKAQKDLVAVEEARKKLEIEKAQPSGPGRVSQASPAEILPDGRKDRRIKLTGVAVVGSFFAAMGLALLRGRFDPHVYCPSQIEAHAGLRILGAVPALSDLKRGRITEEDFAEAYRMVRVNLLSRALGNPPRSILVTSAQASEGKTSLAVSLAVSLAELGGRVLLVDGDVQAPQLDRLLGLESQYKLRDVLSGSRNVAASAVPSRLEKLDVLLGGVNGDNSRGLIEQRTAANLVQDAVAQYDFVVIDSPPALGTADSLIWSQTVDSVIVSTFIGCSDIGATRQVCERLEMVAANVLGAVVCNVSVRNGYASYSYYSSVSRSKYKAQDEARAITYMPKAHGGKASGEPPAAPSN